MCIVAFPPQSACYIYSLYDDFYFVCVIFSSAILFYLTLYNNLLLCVFVKPYSKEV